jgi:CheY-like chemotaxis protein
VSHVSAAHAAPEAFCTVLHIDDDPNDAELLVAAARRARAPFNLHTVEDGDKAMAYLNGVGTYADRVRYPMPSLILLDLKMPRATGFELLKWIRQHPQVGRVPVVVLSGSQLHDDIRQAYAIGANSYIVKPLGFGALVDLVKDVNAVWIAPAVSAR